MCGYFSIERFQRPPPENWAAQSSVGPWSSGTKWVWNHTIDSSPTRTRCPREVRQPDRSATAKDSACRRKQVFVDSEFRPYPDQWAFLASVERMSADAVEAVVREAQERGDLIGVRISIMDDAPKIPGHCCRHKREWKVQYQDRFHLRFKSFAETFCISRRWAASGDVEPSAPPGRISES